MGQLVGIAVWVVIIIGLARTFMRKDISRGQKIWGKSKNWP